MIGFILGFCFTMLIGFIVIGFIYGIVSFLWTIITMFFDIFNNK